MRWKVVPKPQDKQKENLQNITAVTKTNKNIDVHKIEMHAKIKSTSTDTGKTRSATLNNFPEPLHSANNTRTPQQLRKSLHAFIQQNFQSELTERAKHSLFEDRRDMSALSPAPDWMIYSAICAASGIAALIIINPAILLTAFSGILISYYIASLTLKTALAVTAFFSADPPPYVLPQNLPMVTIFLPVHNEGPTLKTLVDALQRIDYPPEKLDLKFLVEEDDQATQSVLHTLDLPPHFEIILIPVSHPRTKPKAMNYALPFARGEVTGIYDAEDMPEPDQVMKAVSALAGTGPETVCVQARLNHYSATRTMLSRMAQAEYTLWFDILLKGLSRLNLPVPLGGTSLFIETKALNDLGGWDPYNVTEDADLGLRLARQGWRAEVIDSTTWEEPPVQWSQWIGQRSRWIKGFIVTWLVHMRSPRALVRDLGWHRALAINIMLLDGFLAFLLQPVCIMALVSPWLMGVAPWGLFTQSGSMPLYIIVFIWIFAAGQALIIMAAFVALTGRFGIGRAKWCPGLWFYWQVATLSAYRALYEMFGKKAFWNKTEHGLNQPDANLENITASGR